MSEIAVPTVNVNALQKQSEFGDDLFGGVGGNRGSFLPRLQLFSASSNEVKEGKIGVASYGVVKGKDELTELGKTILGIPIAWRAKAMNLKADPPQAYHRQDHPEFVDFKKRAVDPNSGYVFGPEFLIWTGVTHGFCVFFMMSATARNASTDLRALLPGPDGRLRVASLSAVLIDNGEHKWHGPKIIPSGQSMDMPPDDLMEMTVKSFLQPKDYDPTQVKKKEAVAAGATDDVAR